MANLNDLSSTIEDEISNEDQDLKQAMILVNILKSEYSKILRENTDLPTTSSEEPTCATTLKAGVNGSHTTGPTNSLLDSHDMNNLSSSKTDHKPISTLVPSLLTSSKAQYLPLPSPIHPFRRRYNIFQNPDKPLWKIEFRREAPKKEAIEASTAQRNSSMDKNTTAPVSIISKSTTNQEIKVKSDVITAVTASDSVLSTQKSKTNLKVKKKNTVSTTVIVTTTKTPNKGAITTSKKKILNGKSKMNTISTIDKITKNAVADQVASELINEFKENELNPIIKYTGKSKTITLIAKRRTAEEFSSSYSYRSSIKIHLGGSTRLPNPLPENNGFCFTNPNNPLCRTFI